jgi:pyruvate dehydrogenase E2 component (dihydrolipoamide acetyltransferase)
MKTGSVIQWHKKEGDRVEKEEPVVEVLSEKVTYDVEAPTTGILRKIIVEEGMDVSVGATLAVITAPDEELPKLETKAPILVEGAEAGTEPAEKKIGAAKERVLASPAAKRLAKEYNVDLRQVQSVSPDKRIVEEDVRRYIEKKTRPKMTVKEDIPLSGIRKSTAERVASSFQTAAHSYIVMNVDMTKVKKLKEETQASYTSLLVKAVAKALSKNPTVNSTLTDGTIRVYDEINVGVAVSTKKGLVVPVIHEADKKEVTQISFELNELVDKARQGKLLREHLTRGTFTVTNLGMYDVDLFLPIINPPEAAILAAGNIVERAIVIDKEVKIKPMMNLVLAYDHRIIDGAPASIFLRAIKDILENTV